LINDKYARCIRRYDIYPAPPENPLQNRIHRIDTAQKQNQKSVAKRRGLQLKPLNPAGAAWAHNLKQKLTQLDNKPLSRAGWQTGKTAFNSFRWPLCCSCIHSEKKSGNY